MSGNTRFLELNHGLMVAVDSEDFDQVSAFKWRAIWTGNQRHVYAGRTVCKGGKRSIVLLHRQLLNATSGKQCVTFIDYDGLNCTRSNLVLSDRTTNQIHARTHSQRDLPRNVYYDEKNRRFQAKMKKNGKVMRVSFRNLQDAVEWLGAFEKRHCAGLEPKSAQD